MIDFGEVEQATRYASPPSNELSDEPGGIHIPAIDIQTAVETQRTGEHTNIQKTYRLTPTAHRVVQELSTTLSNQLSFDINNSVIIRSILRVINNTSPEIQKTIEQLAPRQQPATAIGNEHLRDALEAEIAAAILDGICIYVEKNKSN